MTQKPIMHAPNVRSNCNVKYQVLHPHKTTEKLDFIISIFRYPSQNQKKKLMYQALVQSILLYGAETWSLNTQQANKLLANEMDFWRRSARK
jgi:hypothetical protein